VVRKEGDDAGGSLSVCGNNQALLDLTDLVFVDPIGQGICQVLRKRAKIRIYWGLTEDAINSICSVFMKLWVTEYGKVGQAPKFIAGESYGTTRAQK